MINSATALKLLKTHSACQTIENKDLQAIGYGIYASDLKVWLAQKGFRVDTVRSTYVRWTETWTMTGDVVPIKVNGNPIAFWFGEVPRNVATLVAQMGDEKNLQSIYETSSGMLSPNVCKHLGIIPGGFY